MAAKDQASIKFLIDTDIKEQYEILLSLMGQNMTENLRICIARQVEENRDLIETHQKVIEAARARFLQN